MFQVLLFLLIGINFCCKCNDHPKSTIVPTDILEFPYMVYISTTKPPGLTDCSGFLISKLYVLTTANCVKDSETVSVRIASSNKKESGILLKIDKNDILKHPSYKNLQNDFDFAIIKLPEYDNSDIPGGFLELPKPDTQYDDDAKFIEVGWNLIDNEDNESQLKFLETTYYNKEDCQNILSTEITSSMICIHKIGETSCCSLAVVIKSFFSFVILHTTLNVYDAIAVGFGTLSINKLQSGEICIEKKPQVITHIANVRDWIRNITNI